MVAAGNGFFSLDPLTGSVAELASAPGLPDTRMNDGKCDRAGRFYAGTMAADESPGRGSFYRLDTDLSVTEIFTGIGISNGLGWSPDDTLMYYIDSLAYRVDVMGYDPATGRTGQRQPFVALGSGDVMPDGMAVDAEGGIWVAVWGGGVIQRYDAGRPADRRGARARSQRDELRVRRPGSQHAVHYDRRGARPIGRSAVYLRFWRSRPADIPVHGLIGAGWDIRPFGLSAFSANRGGQVGHDIPMTDNVAAMAGDTGELGHNAESLQTGDSGAMVNPAQPASPRPRGRRATLPTASGWPPATTRPVVKARRPNRQVSQTGRSPRCRSEPGRRRSPPLRWQGAGSGSRTRPSSARRSGGRRTSQTKAAGRRSQAPGPTAR